MPFEPPGPKKSGSFTPNEEAVAMIISMGFNTEQAAKALKNTVGSIGFFSAVFAFFYCPITLLPLKRPKT